jgi:hypothetical protein
MQWYDWLIDATRGEVTAVNWKRLSVVQLYKHSQNWPQYTVQIYRSTCNTNMTWDAQVINLKTTFDLKNIKPRLIVQLLESNEETGV